MLTPEQIEHMRQVRELTHKFVEAASDAPGHRLVLEALMTIFVAIAETHPCCTAEAGRVALKCAGRLISFSSGGAGVSPFAAMH